MDRLDKYVGITNVLLLGEVFFSYSVMSPKLQTNNTVGYELNMRFGDPYEHEFTQVTLLLGAVMSCIVSWLVDNYIGKCYAILFGLISLIAVNTLLMLSELKYSTLERSTGLTLILMIYIATYPTRNVLILEQGFEKSGLRNLIAFLVIIRLVMNVACRAESLVIIENRSMVNDILAVGINILYFAIFIVLVPELMYEPTYSCIWSQCLKCIGLSMARSSMQEKPAGSNWNPLESTARWGFKGIKVKNELRGLPSSNKRQNFMPWLLWFKNLFRSKRAEEAGHWLHLSAPDISNHVIEQTKRVITIFPFVFLPFLMSNIIHFIMIMTMNQTDLTLPLKINFWPGKDVIIYSLLLDLLFFLSFEVVVHPILRRCKLNDLHFIHCGWVFLICALVVTLSTQNNLESNRVFLPTRGKAQLRIYNAMDNDTIVSSQQFPDVYLKSKNVLLQTDIPCHNNSQNFEIEVANQHLGSTKRFVLDLIEGQTVSYIIVYDKMQRNSKTHDPTIFSADINLNSSYIFLIHEFASEKFTYSLINRGTGTKYRLNSEKGALNELEPGSYNLIIYDDYVKIEISPTLNDERTAGNVQMTLSPGSLYGLFLYKEKMENFLVQGKIVLLERPLTRQFWLIFIQLFLTSLGNAVVSVSYYRFLFLQSPDKMRVTTFTTSLVFQFLGLAVNRNVLKFDDYTKTSTLILIYTIVHIVMFIVSAFHAYFYNST